MDYGNLLSQRRDEWTLDTLLKRENLVPDSPITILHQRWTQGLQLTPADSVIETSAESPINWTIPRHQDRWAPDWSHRVGDYPVPQHGIACAMEYWDCLERRQPVCHLIQQDFERADRLYVRLLLPHESGIVYAVRSLVPVVEPGSVPVKRPQELRRAFPDMAGSIRGSTEH